MESAWLGRDVGFDPRFHFRLETDWVQIAHLNRKAVIKAGCSVEICSSGYCQLGLNPDVVLLSGRVGVHLQLVHQVLGLLLLKDFLERCQGREGGQLLDREISTDLQESFCGGVVWKTCLHSNDLILEGLHLPIVFFCES